MRTKPVGILAHKKSNRRDSRWNHSPPILIGSRRFKSRRMRQRTAGSDRAWQAQLIEVRRIVVGDSACQHKTFPRARRNLKTLQLANHFKSAVLSPNLCARSDVLPAQKPSHELRRRDWGDLLAQGCDRQAMNARQQTPLAPLSLGFACGDCRWARIG